ncbi:MAG: sulfatase-like hydrolase/transferase [Planctomycetes bacterium]|nr:sulfatase-like hydrolase/transferase [Planctomycetota bacterium]
MKCCLFALALGALSFITTNFVNAADKPNIVYIYGDDVGYGDLSCQGATKVKTPNLDKLAAAGLRFVDAHAAAATCTPSRYALLTGQYAWREKGTHILPGDAPAIIRPGRVTLPSTLKQAGYATAAVGKWHLGLGNPGMDWNGKIAPGPLEIGFDYCFLIPATGDRVPCVFVEDHSVVGLDPKDPITVSYQHKVGDDPTGKDHPEMLKYKYSHGHDATIVNGISRIGFMTGGNSARWVDEKFPETLTSKAIAFMEKHKNEPFFLYFATQDIHVPRMPNKQFAGSSECGIRGDVIQQLDWQAGRIMDAIDRLGLTDNTIVIFSSDNGPVIDDGYADGAVKDLNGHEAAGPLRGGKYDIHEGGTRVPFILRWPAKVKPGVSEAMICQIDLLASFAAMNEVTLPKDAAPDSFDIRPALFGEDKTGRDTLVEQAGNLALRRGTWKFIEAGRKGKAKGELYDLGNDLAEKKNVIDEHPEVASDLSARLDQIKAAGHTRPGAE